MNNFIIHLFRRAGRLSATLAALAALSVTTTGVASAALAARAPIQPDNGLIQDAAASNSLSGYQTFPTGGLASASVTFTIPTTTCNATDADSTQYLGVATDTLDTVAVILMECVSLEPIYYFDASTLSGATVEAGAHPGDVVVTSLFQTGTSTWAEVHDLTQNLYWYDNNSVNQGDTGIDLGSLSFSANGYLVPKFTTVTLANATVNGDYLGFESPTQYNALNGGDVLIKSGKLQTSGTGSRFSLKFRHSF